MNQCHPNEQKNIAQHAHSVGGHHDILQPYTKIILSGQPLSVDMALACGTTIFEGNSLSKLILVDFDRFRCSESSDKK